MGLDFVEILMETEETFGISLPDAEVAELATPGDLYEVIVRQVRARPIDVNADDPPTTPWSEDRIWAQLQQIIADELGLDVAEVTREAHLVRDLGCG